MQREADQKLEAEQAERAAEDARLRELYPLPEDDQEYEEKQLLSDVDDSEFSKKNESSSQEERIP